MGVLKLWQAVVLFVFAFGMEAWAADYSIDNTCTSCSRRELDSLNVYDRRPIRLNQVGFRPQDPKKAFVANPAGTTFRVISKETGSEAWSGTLESLGNVPRPGIWINGAFNSITSVYHFGDSASAATGTEPLYQASFSELVAPGRYVVVVGTDTSAVFRVDDKIYNYIFENSLKFFGVNRCGATDSWIHGACHLKDGSAVGHNLTGGWHDCGDHFKVSETIGYTAFMLTLTYALWPEKAEDFFGASYNDTLPFGTDGIPDLLWESKVGVDYLFKLYKASKADGLIASSDMYHSVGVAGVDHNYWDKPERQDAQPLNRGGPDRVVANGAGANVTGMYAAAMAFFAWGWELFDPVYADSLKNAAIDIYDNVVMKKRGVGTTGLGGFYTGLGRMDDDPAGAALALLVATKDHRFYVDLVENTALNNNGTAQYNDGEFPAGHFGNGSGFHHGGWTTDYQQIHAPVMYGFAKLILGSDARAAEYGVSPAVRDSLLVDAVACLRKSVDNGSNGANTVPTRDGYAIHVDKPYGGVFTSVDWGFNRYNMGLVNELFMLWDLTGERDYFDIGLDNLNYNLGMNPWDLSFMMGAGDKNLQHPHNRAANPDGYNAGGFPYEYRCPKGALMGGARPTKTLKDDWNDYTVTETCIDFSAQIVLPAQMLAKDLPPDNKGPLFSNVQANPIDQTTAIISWETNELAQVTVYLSESAGGTIIDSLFSTGLSKAGSVQARHLAPGRTYYFYLKGQDIRRNVSTEDNHGEWYSFTMTSNPATISSVRICQVDDQSARIYWWTANGAYNGMVKYGTSAASLDQVAVGDKGLPVLFHEVLLTGLTPGTTYYFDVVSGSSTDDKGGSHYSFTTEAHAVYLDYTITIKPTKKKNPSAHFYLEVVNNEPKPYKGLEIRFYFKTATVNPTTVNIQCNDNAIFDVGGNYNSMTPIKGAPVQVLGTDQWYIPITISEELPVAGRARIEMEMHTNGWNDLPWSELAGSWSLIAHNDPVNFAGVDLSKGLVYAGPDHVEIVNGVPEITYVRDPFITAYYEGKHIFGFPPDFADGHMPVSKRSMYMTFTSPFASPQTSVEQQDFAALFAGSSWTTPIGTMDLLEMNALDISNAMTYPVASRKDSILFSHSVANLAYGANRHEFVAWYNSNANANATNKYDCACAYQRLMIEVDTLVVPRIKRWLKFDPADTVEFYQGKRKSVKIQLVDSVGAIQTGQDVSISLAALLPGFEFWADANATAPIAHITLVNGAAEFYVSYSSTGTSPIISTLNAGVENGSDEYNYIVVNPVLVAAPPPPWPLIDAARMVDTNCDQIPDAIDIMISGAFTPGRYEFTSVKFEFEGDTLSVAQKTDVSANLIRVSFASPSGMVNTVPVGKIWMSVNVVGQEEKESEAFYTDGIGPVVLSVSILEKAGTSSKDSLFVQFSEPVSAPSGWFFRIFDAQGNAIAATPIVNSAKIAKEENNIWVFEIAPPVGEPQPIQEGVSVQLRNDATLTDRNGNAIEACDFAKLRVSVKRRPIPMVYASISDEDGDAIAEQVLVRFEKAVDSLHQPDSITVVFGFLEPETLSTKAWNWNAKKTEATLQLASPFRLGNTAGTYNGFLESREVLNAGFLTQHKGAGADYEAGETLAEDLVGPILLAATHGSGRASDSLLVKFSEPVSPASDTVGRVHLLRERGGSVAFQPSSMLLASSKTAAQFLFDPESPGAVTEGDRVRFDPQVSRYLDASGNEPEFENPWVTISGNSSVKVKINVSMREKVTRGGNGRGYGDYPPSSKEQFRISVLNQRTGKLDLWQDGMLMTAGIDTATYQHQGPVFLVDLRVPRGSAVGEKPVWDSVNVKFDIGIFTNLGGFVNQIKDAIVLRNQDYLDNANQVKVSVEWLSPNGTGPASKSGRVAGSGAYIAKSVISSVIHVDFGNAKPDVVTRYDGQKTSHSENWLFGFQRPK